MVTDNTNNEQTENNNVPATDEIDTPEDKSVNIEPAKSWFDDFSDEIKTNPSITKFKSAEALAKSYLEASKKLGQKGLTPLPKDATPEQRAAYNSIRRGDSIQKPEDYSFAKDSDSAELVALKKALFDAGADDYMASEVLGKLAQMNESADAEMISNAEQVYSKEAEKLRLEWGEDYEVNIKANDILLSKYPEAERILKGLGADKMSGVALMLHRLNALSSDGEIKISQARNISIDERLAQVCNSDAYKQKWHPDHQKAQDERARLIMLKVKQG